MNRAKCIMVQGTMSGAGKSLLCAALCRIFAQDGLRAVPFKSQNMALNSFVTKDGLEMGRAQVVQAQAAGVEPDVRMNPILLKPSSDVGSQVIVNGEVRGQMKASEYFRTKRQLVPDILKAYDSLAEEADVIVIEGAGSPAEINLQENDIVNMGLARMVDAPVLLVGDIDRMKQQSVSLKFLQVTTGTLVPTATVVLKFGDHERMAIATGNGPVDAAVSAIKTLINEKVVLMEFLMQAITRGSNDVGRVHVQVQCGSRTVHGFAAHTDTTRASIEAFLDALRVLNVTERKEKEE